MRKIISLTLATAMVASMAVSAFAAGKATDTATIPSEPVDKVTTTTPIHKIAFDLPTTVAADTTLKMSFGSEKVNVPLTKDMTPQQVVGALKDALNNLDELNVEIYTTATRPASANINWEAEQDAIVTYPKNAAAAEKFQEEGAPVAMVEEDGGLLGAPETTEIETPAVAPGAVGWNTDDGTADQIICLTPLVEKSEDLNDADGSVKPGKTVYFKIWDYFQDEDDFDIHVSKGENPKQIKSISVVDKNFSSSLVGVGGEAVPAGTTGRQRFIKIELIDNMTDKEYKVSFDMKVKVERKGGVDGVDKGVSKKFEDVVKFWVGNVGVSGQDDIEYLAGEGGIMVKPVKNEENTVLWTDENRDLAKLTFTADSDVAKYFPKLSTKWPNATYAQLFDDQDAFVFDFVGNPKISSTSRAVLELFCPFIDSDDEYTIDPESVVIYQVADDATLAASTEVELAKAILDGRLLDVTDKFTAGENEDGDFVYTTKTRTLGTYIIAEKAPSEEAFEEAEGVAEAPEEKPAEDTGKTNPGTGR